MTDNNHNPTDDSEDTNPEVQSTEFVTRLEDLCALPKGQMAVADHGNGILIYGPNGDIFKHLNGDQDTLAYSVKYDPKSKCLLALILDVPGWQINFYNIRGFDLKSTAALPNPSDIPRMKLRWLSVTPDGDILVIVGHTIWAYDTDLADWTKLHEDFRPGAWFSSLIKLPNQGNRYLACYKGSQVQEVRLDGDGLSVITKNVIPKGLIKELGAIGVDKNGNVFLGDWDSGAIIQLNKAYEVVKSVGNVGQGQAYVIAFGENNKLYMGCKSSLEVRVFDY